jgi:hypothetical protein
VTRVVARPLFTFVSIKSESTVVETLYPILTERDEKLLKFICAWSEETAAIAVKRAAVIIVLAFIHVLLCNDDPV